MVARVVRELTADEVVRDGGVRIGDFGTGGRRYVYYTRGNSSGCNRCLLQCIAAVIIVIAIGFEYVKESAYTHVEHCCTAAHEDALVLSPPFQRDARNDHKIVFAASRNPKVVKGTSPTVDPFFDVVMAPTDAVVAARRVTEYCQWQEHSITNHILVGRDPNCEHNDDRCNIYRDEISFVYTKGWVPRLIHSNMFDNPVAYHNPHRDPAPSLDLSLPVMVTLDGSGGDDRLRIASHTLDAILSWEPLAITAEMTRQLSDRALAHHFSEVDSRYVYSRGPRDGWLDNGLVKAAAGYFVDGVIGVDLLSHCNAGDIRIHFEVKALHPNVGFSVAAEQQPSGLLEPFRIPDEKESCIVGYADGRLSLDDTVERVLKDGKWWLWVTRLCCLAGVALGAYLLYLSNPNKESDAAPRNTDRWE